MSESKDLIPKMWEVLNTLSDDARKSALKKCKELEFDINKGEVPLDELIKSIKEISFEISYSAKEL